MFKNFEFKEDGTQVERIGYTWDLDNPDYVVCIIHGLGELAARYDRVSGYLNKSNIAVVSMDLRGHGLSGGKRGHCAPREHILKDVDELIETAQHRYPNKPIILYGHSLGGNITLDYKSRGIRNNVPVAYVISAPWLILKNPPSKILRSVVSIFSRIAPSAAIASAIEEKVLGHPDSVRPYHENHLVHDKISLQAGREGLEIGEAIVAGSLEDNGGAKGKPWLLMHGTEDRICDFNGSKALFERAPENCTFILWDGLFHEIHNGSDKSRGEEVILRMIEWVLALPA